MNKLEKIEKVMDMLPTLKNYTVVLAIFLILNDNKRYTLQNLMDATTLPSASVQTAIKELEDTSLLIRTKIDGKKRAPKFSMFPKTLDSSQCKVG